MVLSRYRKSIAYFIVQILGPCLFINIYFLQAQVSISAVDLPFTQNFNTLATSGISSTLPAGWQMLETGAGANINYTGDNGSLAIEDTYSYGSTASTDRALGELTSASVMSRFGVAHTNNSGVTITSLLIYYIGEQWRLGATGRADKLDFQYSLDATSLSTGTWTDVDVLDFTAPVTTGTIGAIDGNATGNRTAIGNTISGLSIANGATFWIRWSFVDASGSDDGVSVDDFSLTANPSTPHYTITNAGGLLTISDDAGSPDVMSVTENGTNIKYEVIGRTYRLNGGPLTYFPAEVPLAGLTSVTINANAGNDIINHGGFTSPFTNLTINGGTGNDIVNLNGDITFAANNHLDLDLQNDDASPGTDQVNLDGITNLILSGNGAASIKVSQSVKLTGTASIETVDGNLTVEANQQATPTTGSFAGVDIQGGTLKSSGTGIVQVNGKGGNTGNNQYGIYLIGNSKITGGTSGTHIIQGTGGASTGINNHGIYLTGSGSLINSNGGHLTITGLGGGAGAAGINHGVTVNSSALISPGGTGNVTIQGTGGVGTGIENYGVQLSSATITSAGGNVSITGLGGGSSGSANNYGIYLQTTSTISAGGSGTVMMNGTGGPNNAAINHGIYVNNSTVTSTSGNVTVTGHGGVITGTNSNGVRIENQGVIKAGSTGSVSVTGNGNGSVGDNIVGVLVSGFNSKITSSGGNITVVGNGGGSANGSNSHGVSVVSMGVITAVGSGHVSVTGTGASNNGFTHAGVYVNGASTEISSAGGNVTIMGTGGGGSTSSGIGVHVLGQGKITAGGTGTMTVTGQGGANTFNDNYGVFVTGTNSIISTNNGNVQINGTGGGTTNSTGNYGVYLQSAGKISAGGTGTMQITGISGQTSGNSNYGVFITGSESSVLTNNGNITVSGTGRGLTTSASDHGVYLSNLGKISAGGSGIVTVNGFGGQSTGNTHYGVFLQDFNTQITSAGGNVFVNGTGGGTGGSNHNYGVYVLSGSKITSTGAGAISIDGDGGLGTGGNNYGVFVSGGNTQVTSTSGSVSVVGTGGSAASGNENTGVYVFNQGKITAGLTGTVTIIGNGGMTNGLRNYGVHVSGTNSVINSNNGNVTVTGMGGSNNGQTTHYGVYVQSGGSIKAGGAGHTFVQGTGGAGISQNNHGVFIQNNTSFISSSGGNVTVIGTAGGIATAVASGLNWGVHLNGGFITSEGNGVVTVTGTGGIGLGNTHYGVYLFNNGYITSSGGNISVTGTGGGSNTSTNNHGILVNSGSYILANGAGTVSVTGFGGATVGTSNIGVSLLSTTPASVSSGGGNVTVQGTGGGSGASNQNYGVFVSGKVTAGGSGTVNVSGFGGPSNGGQNYGLLVNGGTITSTLGNVIVNGTGHAGSPTENTGVVINNAGVIKSDVSGNVTVTGTGGGTNTLNHGIQVSGINSMITSSGGSVSVNGQGGGSSSGNTCFGLEINNAGKISAGGSGNVTVSGTGGPGTANNYGIQISGTNSTVTSSGGNVNLIGQGGTNPTGTTNTGVRLEAAAIITAGGLGKVNIVGTGGTSSGSANHGILLTGANSTVTSSGGDVHLSGVVSNAAGNLAINSLASTFITTATNGGDIKMSGNSMQVQGTVSTNTMDTVTCVQNTNGVAINLGTSGDPENGPLQLTDTELDQITTGTLVIGNANSGVISVTNNITRPGLTHMRLSSGGDIVFSAGSIHTSGGNLHLDPHNMPMSTKPVKAGNDATCNMMTLDGPLSIQINGPLPDIDYTQMQVAGSIDLNNAPFMITGSYSPSEGQSFIVIDNDNADAVVGQFQGLEQGDSIFNVLSSPLHGVISYTGGDGNDVVVTIVSPCTIPDQPTLEVNPPVVCIGQPATVTITAGNLNDAVTWEWYEGSCNGPVIGTGNSINVVATQATTYFARGVGGCVTTSSCGQASITVNEYPDPNISMSDPGPCYYTQRTFQPEAPPIPGASYTWSFGANAVPASANTYGPHNVYYTVAGSKTAKLVIHPNAPGAQCPDSTSVTFDITSCPGQILGKVLDSNGLPMTNVNVKLYVDANANGIPDSTGAIRNIFTSSSGTFNMASLHPNHYLIIQTQPSQFLSLDDGDLTPDGDVVANTDSLDNKIPASLIPNKVDSNNVFVEMPAPGGVTGVVFDDFNVNENPDSGEGIANVTVKILPDANANGVADNNIPVATATTNSFGAFTFLNIPSGNYVLVEVQPAGMDNIKDFDPTDDDDVVPNSNTTNDTIPFTLDNGEADTENFFIDGTGCSLLVTNSNDSGYGSFRQAIECADSGDTIRFHANMAGQSININSEIIEIHDDIVILSSLNPRVIINSQVYGLFLVHPGANVEMVNLKIISGLALPGFAGGIDNEGILTLKNVQVLRNPYAIAGTHVIYNFPGSLLKILGTTTIDFD